MAASATSPSGAESPPLDKGTMGRRGAMATIAMAAGLVVSYGTATIYGVRYLFGRQKPPPDDSGPLGGPGRGSRRRKPPGAGPFGTKIPSRALGR